MPLNARLRARGYRVRPARVNVNCDGILTELDGCEVPVVVLDVSSSGFRLESRAELEPGSEVLIRVQKLAPVRAQIRWTCGHEAGGVFLDPVAL